MRKFKSKKRVARKIFVKKDNNRKLSHSQNFFKEELDVRKLISKTDISGSDAVVEIGSGTGIITNALLKKAGKVIAIELDDGLYSQLKINFKDNNNLILLNKNFLDWEPRKCEKYKIFSNIPFNTTADIIKRIVEVINPTPISTYLIIQKEAAEKYLLQKDKNSLLSVVYYPIYNIQIIKEISRFAFKPIPRVSIVLLSIKKRMSPLIKHDDYVLFKDFVSFCFSSWKKNLKENLLTLLSEKQVSRFVNKSLLNKKPSQLNFDEWILIFNYFKNNTDKMGFNNIFGTWRKIKKQQQNLSKRHRTTKLMRKK